MKTGGVNVICMPYGMHGLGACARDKIRGLISAGVEICVIEQNYSSLSRRVDAPDIDPFVRDEPVFDTNLVLQNLPATFLIARDRPDLMEGRHNIGSPYWEFPELPEPHLRGLDCLDELWVDGTFLQTIFSAHTDLPVIKLPMHLSAARDAPTKRSGKENLVFGYSFDCNSMIERKDPALLVLAFLEAFADQPNLPVRLNLKYKYEPQPYVRDSEVQRFLELAALDPRISLLGNALSDKEMAAYIHDLDVYVSPHRAEGLGRGMVDAMFAGTALLATNYSGSTDFLFPECSIALDSFQTHVGDAAVGDIRPNYTWHEARLEPLITSLQRLADDPVQVRMMGAKAVGLVASCSGTELFGAEAKRLLRQRFA